MDIIRGKARRRWSVEEKREIVAETFMPGSSVNGVAKRYDVSPSVLFLWRKQFRTELGQPAANRPLSFAAVTLTEPASAGAPASLPSTEARMSVEFGNGARMVVSGAVDPALVTAVTKALARR
jgi:transposase